MNKYKVGFSLVELMVVIAIVAILAAVAIPSYKQYVLNTQISNGLSQIPPQLQKLIQIYDTTGEFPETIALFNNVALTAGEQWTGVSSGNVCQAAYSRSTDKKGALIKIAMGGLSGIHSAYQNPCNSEWTGQPHRSAAFYAVRETNGVFNVACGQYSTGYGDQYIPFSNLPGNCQSNGVQSFCGSGCD